MKAVSILLGAVVGVMAFAVGLLLLVLGILHMLDLRGGDSFDLVLPIPGAFLVVLGAALCWRFWRRLRRDG